MSDTLPGAPYAGPGPLPADLDPFSADVSDLEQIRPEPTTLRLKDGREVSLMFDMEALAWLERRIGSLVALEGLGKFDRPVIEPLVYVIAAGMRHDPRLNVRVQRNRESDETIVLVGDTPLLRLLDTRELRNYVKVVERALRVALPFAGAVAAMTANGARASTGGASTTPAPSYSGEPSAVSGA